MSLAIVMQCNVSGEMAVVSFPLRTRKWVWDYHR